MISYSEISQKKCYDAFYLLMTTILYFSFCCYYVQMSDSYSNSNLFFFFFFQSLFDTCLLLTLFKNIDFFVHNIVVKQCSNV